MNTFLFKYFIFAELCYGHCSVTIILQTNYETSPIFYYFSESCLYFIWKRLYSYL